MILIGPHYRKSGQEPAVGEVRAMEFIRASFDPALHLQGFATAEFYSRHAYRMVVSCDRWEVYVFGDDLEPVAVAHYTDSHDIHHGVVAVPVTVLTKHEYRGCLEVSRLLSSGIKQAVELLGCSLYYTMKHISPTVQQHRLRKL
ncbi:putative host specificity protein [Aeromonas phage 25AhydR2PP]|uniref:Host specificity protein n=1 Tax=Aeromonas phage 25AhydR2PP TaxID=2163976 RepID=A0A2S1PFR3_9CAUD|nr:host range and adsorption protein [Aeromonas phage 25AhydR2PP]AWH15413.1 putative host specificity protein [Aeromonas phage 25AhydR2PP]